MNRRKLIGFEVRRPHDMATDYEVYKTQCSFQCAEDKYGDSMGKGFLKANGKIYLPLLHLRININRFLVQ